MGAILHDLLVLELLLLQHRLQVLLLSQHGMSVHIMVQFSIQIVIVILRVEKVQMALDFVLIEDGQALLSFPVIVIAKRDSRWLGDRPPLAVDDLRAAECAQNEAS